MGGCVFDAEIILSFVYLLFEMLSLSERRIVENNPVFDKIIINV